MENEIFQPSPNEGHSSKGQKNLRKNYVRLRPNDQTLIWLDLILVKIALGRVKPIRWIVTKNNFNEFSSGSNKYKLSNKFFIC